jgi:hypothetical protein
MADLLKIIKFNNLKKTPLMFEFKVKGELAPFLVTNSKSILWVDAPNDTVRAGVRVNTRVKDFFMEVINELATVGDDAQWGNTHEFSPEGVQEAISYLQGYEVGALEVLVHPNSASDIDVAVKVTNTHWLPEKCAVVVPQDRDFLGFIGLIGKDFVGVVHNPSRGLSIARSV